MINESQPLVSVLMTSYNRADFIAESIESVLASSYVNFELIIVDDCSADNTIEIANKYAEKDTRIKVYTNEANLGDYPNRNKAASYASGKYIKYVDSDDILYSHALYVMVSAMEKFPNAGFGLAAHSDREKPYPVEVSSENIYKEHFNGYGHFFRAPGSAIIRKDAFEEVGCFSGERMIGDTDLWYRMSMYYPMAKFVSNLNWDRSHPGQELQSEYAKREYKQLQKMVFDRYMLHKDNPLSEQDKNEINKTVNTSNIKNHVVNYLRRAYRLLS